MILTNGKNFDNYQCYIELYETLRQFYRDDSNVNLPFCDYCFANLCPLSRWYYENCEPNEQIPMNIQQKAEMITAMIFPDLYDDSEDVEIKAIPEEWEEQLSEHPEWLTEFLQACAAETDSMAVVSHLWTEPPEQQLQQAAEQVFYFMQRIFCENKYGKQQNGCYPILKQSAVREMRAADCFASLRICVER